LVESFPTGIVGLDLSIWGSHQCGSSIHVAGKPGSGSIGDSQKASQTFESAVLEAVDYGLAVLGETARQGIYSYIGMKYQVKREEIPEKLDVFHKASSGLFGAGAGVVEKLIARRLYSKLGLGFEEHEDWTLVEYVNHAKKARGEG
jgi:hypothetical protein